MKNFICIDVDTDRNPVIMLTKTEKQETPSDFESARDMVLLDISCLCETLAHLIIIAGESEYADKTLLVKATTDRLNDLLVQETEKTEENKNENIH